IRPLLPLPPLQRESSRRHRPRARDRARARPGDGRRRARDELAYGHGVHHLAAAGRFTRAYPALMRRTYAPGIKGGVNDLRAEVQYGGDGNDILHALANDNQPDILNCGPGYDVAYVIVHDPARFHGCEQVIRLTPEEAASMAAANDDNG